MKKYIAIVTALESEISWILRHISYRIIASPPMPLLGVIDIDSRQVLLVTTGPGKVNASAHVQAVHSVFPLERVIVTGTSGSISPKVRTGDVVLSTRIMYHDFGSVRGDAFTPCHIPVYSEKENKTELSEYFSPPESFVQRAETTCRNRGTWPVKPSGTFIDTGRVHKGPIATGDQVVMNPSMAEAIASRTGALACDMESAAVAQVCEIHSIPCIAIRVISDEVLGGAMDKIPIFSGPDLFARKNLRSLVRKKMIASPGQIHILRNLRSAFRQTGEMCAYLAYRVAAEFIKN
jgi:adenosylhomocysteine nucleosidase